MLHEEQKVIAAKTAFGGAIFGITLNEWVAIVTIMYFVLQMILIFPDIKKKYFSKKNDKN